MKRTITAAALTLGLIATGSLFAAAKQVTTTGSTTVFPVVQRCAEAFMDRNPAVNVTVRGGGSGVGISALISGTAQIGNSSREIKSKELAMARSKGVNPKAIIIARDGIVVVVNPANGVKNLTIDQLHGMFTGTITSWKEVGGKNESIVVISRDTSSGTYEVWAEKVLRGKKLKNGALMLAANKAVASTIAETPNAIGYIGIAFMSKEMKAITVNGLTATEASVRDGSYPIARPLYMYTSGNPQGDVKQFIDFVLSPDGQKLVKEVGYVSIK